MCEIEIARASTSCVKFKSESEASSAKKNAKNIETE